MCGAVIFSTQRGLSLPRFQTVIVSGGNIWSIRICDNNQGKEHDDARGRMNKVSWGLVRASSLHHVQYIIELMQA